MKKTEAVRVAEINRDKARTEQIVLLLQNPLFAVIAALVALENLQRMSLIGKNVSTALEAAIATEAVIKSLAEAASKFLPIPKITLGG